MGRGDNNAGVLHASPLEVRARSIITTGNLNYGDEHTLGGCVLEKHSKPIPRMANKSHTSPVA